MSELTNYIQERIKELKDQRQDLLNKWKPDINNRKLLIYSVAIAELQAVLSKIEELWEKESEESRLEALNLKRLMERDYPQELNK